MIAPVEQQEFETLACRLLPVLAWPGFIILSGDAGLLNQISPLLPVGGGPSAFPNPLRLFLARHGALARYEPVILFL